MGGFLVSAALGSDGMVAALVIVTSTVGGSATVLAPWVGHGLSVKRASDEQAVPTVPVQTRAGVSYSFGTTRARRSCSQQGTAFRGSRLENDDEALLANRPISKLAHARSVFAMPVSHEA
jgi:hypothetical protein